METAKTLIGFLRGINVGGHHKVPMAQLRQKFTDLGFKNVKTLLNSGNVVFEISENEDASNLESKIETELLQAFGFTIPVILQTKTEIENLVHTNPFAGINLHKDLRLYVSFLKTEPTTKIILPHFSTDKSYQIISQKDRIVCSFLDLSKTKTPKAMDDLEKLFGKNITTRNWNTVLKVVNLV